MKRFDGEIWDATCEIIYSRIKQWLFINQRLFFLIKNQNFHLNIIKEPLTSILIWFQSSLKDIELVFSGLDCYNTNRFVPVQNETEIERLAHISQNNGSFLAGWSKLQVSYKKQIFIWKPFMKKDFLTWYHSIRDM